RHRSTGLRVELFDLDHISHRDLVLLAAGLDDCVRRHRVLCSAGARYRCGACAGLGCGPIRCPACRQLGYPEPGDNCSRLRDQRGEGQTATLLWSGTLTRRTGRPGRGPPPRPRAGSHYHGRLLDVVVLVVLVVLVAVLVDAAVDVDDLDVVVDIVVLVVGI